MSTLAQQEAAYLDEYSRLQGGGHSELVNTLKSYQFYAENNTGIKVLSHANNCKNGEAFNVY